MWFNLPMSPILNLWRHLAVLCFTLYAAVLPASEFAITRATRDARGRAQISVATEPGYYYLLLRGPRPDACTFPVDIRMGVPGETVLFDSMPAQGSAFFA